MKKQRSTPTIGGQSARMIYDLIEAAPKAVLSDGTVYLDLRLCEVHGREWREAYEWVERQVMSELEACETRHEHRPMLPHEWRAMVIHSMADHACRLLGITDPHPHWC